MDDLTDADRPVSVYKALALASFCNDRIGAGTHFHSCTRQIVAAWYRIQKSAFDQPAASKRKAISAEIPPRPLSTRSSVVRATPSFLAALVAVNPSAFRQSYRNASQGWMLATISSPIMAHVGAYSWLVIIGHVYVEHIAVLHAEQDSPVRRHPH